jgi:hypothetical protein
MLLGIWLVPCQQVPRLGALVYVDWFTRDAIHKCGDASLGFLCEVFLLAAITANNSTILGGNGSHDLLVHYTLAKRVEPTKLSLEVHIYIT